MSEEITFKITFDQPVTVFQLTLGGYFPLPIAHSSAILTDRNIIGILRQIGVSHDRGDHKTLKWWFDILNSTNCTLNPLFNAMEGKNKTTPSFNDFVSEFECNINLIKKLLPRVNVIVFNKNDYKEIYDEFIEKHKNKKLNEKKFLVEIIPLIKQKASDKKIINIESKIFKTAKNYGIPNSSLIMLAVLSCLYEDKHGKIPSIGRKLIKPTDSYNEDNAHNVLSDLRCLELLIINHAFFGNKFSFITRDKALAAFWCAINPTNHNYVLDATSCEIELTTKLFPRLNEDEIILLAERLAAKN